MLFPLYFLQCSEIDIMYLGKGTSITHRICHNQKNSITVSVSADVELHQKFQRREHNHVHNELAAKLKSNVHLCEFL